MIPLYNFDILICNKKEKKEKRIHIKYMTFMMEDKFLERKS